VNDLPWPPLLEFQIAAPLPIRSLRHDSDRFGHDD
jgi:hypothetical protein